MPTTPDTLASRVSARRLALGLTQKDLATKCGCTVTTISSIECGRHEDVSRSMLEALSESLGLSLDELSKGTRAKSTRRTS